MYGDGQAQVIGTGRSPSPRSLQEENMSDPLLYCSRCGYPIGMGAIVDEKSDRENPDYMHVGCLETERAANEQATQPSPQRGFGTIPAFMFGL